MNKYRSGGWYNESYRHSLAARGISSKKYLASKSDKSPLSFSRFLDDVKGTPQQAEPETQLDYFALAQRPNTSVRSDPYYAQKKGILSNPTGDQERESLRAQDVHRLRSDFVGRLDKMLRSGDLTGSDRERWLERNFSKYVDEYMQGYIDYEQFERDAKKDFERFTQVHKKRLPIFDWAKENNK